MKLSIITINYNNKAGVEKTIKSVLSQIFIDYEYIIIDGGSTDGSLEVIKKYNKYFSYWCSEPDNGIYNAMNKGVAHAHGEYVIFMNSGDRFYNERVLFDIDLCNRNSDIISGYAKKEGQDAFMHEHSKDIILQILFSCISHQATFIKKELLERYPYDESYKIASDWKFWIETIVINNCNFEFSNVVVAIQDQTGISTSHLNTELENNERQRIIFSFFPRSIVNELRTFVIYNNNPTIKYLLYLQKKSPRIYVLLHRIVWILAWITGKR